MKNPKNKFKGIEDWIEVSGSHYNFIGSDEIVLKFFAKIN